MKARTLLLFVVATLVLALGAVTTACDDDGDGGGEQLTLEAYFQELAQLDAAKDARIDELEAEADEALASAESDEDAIKIFQDEFSGGLDATKTFVDGIADLNPPAEAKDAHDNAVEKGREAIEALEGVLEKINDAKTEDDLTAAISDDFITAAEDFEQTCVDLQAIADEKGVDTDLDCD